ncbi:hypothetical protein G7Y89_g2925 [Cudoniella acicularis]|uniref:Uncharacterized protein n=1 Tax=Cudoniella acicularis TaxID=354080 RepID=A0A8H4RSC8_9HELO|nr:hypothetical protein G7Y89_g2925 [Cudoniella acicularis]
MDYSDIPKIPGQYPEKPLHQLAVLRLIRPHPGLYLHGDEDDGTGTSLRDQRAAFDAHGIDILLIVIRQLLSFGYGIDIPPGLQLTAAESMLLDVAMRDLGWQNGEDWIMKRSIVDQLQSQKQSSTPSVLSFAELLAHPQLSNLFTNNLQFRMISQHHYSRAGPTGKQPEGEGKLESGKWEYNSQELVDQNVLRTKSSSQLGLWITNKFNETSTASSSIRMLSRRPKFLRITLDVSPPGCPLSDLKILQFRAPEIYTKWVHNSPQVSTGIQEAMYQLCAVVRTHSEGQNSERVRAYWKDGAEIVPAQVGIFEQKEPDLVSDQEWSIQQEGSYELFYFRVCRPEGWPEQQMDDQAEESQARSWVQRSEARKAVSDFSSPVISPIATQATASMDTGTWQPQVPSRLLRAIESPDHPPELQKTCGYQRIYRILMPFCTRKSGSSPTFPTDEQKASKPTFRRRATMIGLLQLLFRTPSIPLRYKTRNVRTASKILFIFVRILLNPMRRQFPERYQLLLKKLGSVSTTLAECQRNLEQAQSKEKEAIELLAKATRSRQQLERDKAAWQVAEAQALEQKKKDEESDIQKLLKGINKLSLRHLDCSSKTRTNELSSQIRDKDKELKKLNSELSTAREGFKTIESERGEQLLQKALHEAKIGQMEKEVLGLKLSNVLIRGTSQLQQQRIGALGEQIRGNGQLHLERITALEKERDAALSAKDPLHSRVNEQALLIRTLESQLLEARRELQQYGTERDAARNLAKKGSEELENAKRLNSNLQSELDSSRKKAAEELQAAKEAIEKLREHFQADLERCSKVVTPPMDPAGGRLALEEKVVSAPAGPNSISSNILPKEAPLKGQSTENVGLRTPPSDGPAVDSSEQLDSARPKKRRKNEDEAGPEAKMRSEWHDMAKGHCRMLVELTPSPDSDIPVAMRVIAQIFLCKKDTVLKLQEYKKVPLAKRQEWQCLSTIISIGHRYAEKIQADFQCKDCRGSPWCVQVKDQGGILFFRMVGKDGKAVPALPLPITPRIGS